MNNIIIQSIRAVIVFGVALFVLVNDALAAPMLTPVAVTHLTGNSATLVGHISNPQKNSTVWFEIYNNYGAPTAVAMQGIWSEGTFEYPLNDLNPGQTYSYRAVATEGGVTVYSPTSSFTASVQKTNTPTTIYQENTPPATVQPPVQKTAPKVSVKKDVVAPVVAKEGFTNTNAASVIGAGDGILPNTLIGWILLLVAILVMVLVAHMVYESLEKRKKAREEKNEMEEGEDEEGKEDKEEENH